MYKKVYYLMFYLFFLALGSCNKSWLNPDPKSILTPENVYNSEDGFHSLLISMRKNLKKEMYGQRHPIAGEYTASDLAVPIFQMDWRKTTPSVDVFWKYLELFSISYGAIKDANVAISRIDDIEWEDDEEMNSVLAEAYWHRAYWYYRLINTYGDVPWSGEEISEAKLDYLTYSRWTILDKIEQDLKFAVEWLPTNSEPGGISRGAGNMLLAKVALANTDFDQAITSTTDVINGPYSLMENRFGADADNPEKNVIWDLHRPKNISSPTNKEVILSTRDRFEGPSEARSDGTFTMRLYNCAFYNSVAKDSQGKHGTIDKGGQYDSLGRGNADVRLNPFYQYELWEYGGHTYKNTPDLRRSDINWIDLDEIYYNDPNSVNYKEPLNRDWFASDIDSLQANYAMPFYITYVPQQDGGTPNGGNSDWYIFRLAGAYLLRAEAYLWKEDLELAKNDINKIRERANADPISSDEVSIDFIFDERARELFGEEPRHSELVRVSYIMAKMNLDGYSLEDFSEKNYFYDRIMAKNIFYTQAVRFYDNTCHIEPYHVLWPIDQNVITANTKGRINQNEGYNGAENNEEPITDPIED